MLLGIEFVAFGLRLDYDASRWVLAKNM